MRLLPLSFLVALQSSAQFYDGPSVQLYDGLSSVAVYPEQQMMFPTQQVIYEMPSFAPPPPVPLFGVPPPVFDMNPPASTVFSAPATFNVPSFYVETGLPSPQAPPQAPLDIPHPSVIAEEQRKNVEQARQNLELKIKEMTESSEQLKKSVADQANQQIVQYAQSLEDQVKRVHEAVDTNLKSDIEGFVRTIQEYEQRLKAQAAHTLSLYREKLVAEATEKARQEYTVQESHAKAELNEQLKSARAVSQGGSQQGSADWVHRAQTRYSEQVQQLQEAMHENIQKMAAEITAALNQPEEPETNAFVVEADSLEKPRAPAALAMTKPEAQLDQTN